MSTPTATKTTRSDISRTRSEDWGSIISDRLVTSISYSLGMRGRELNTLSKTASPWPRVMPKGSTKARFFEVLAQRTISATDLDDLSIFAHAPFTVDGEWRQQSLIKLLLEAIPSQGREKDDVSPPHGISSGRRRRASADPVKDFLGSCYAEAIGSERWVVPEALAPARSKWALYARNEMMSLAWYTFFKLALDELDGVPKPFHDVRNFADWLLSRPSFAFDTTRDFDSMLEADRLAAPDVSSLSARSRIGSLAAHYERTAAARRSRLPDARPSSRALGRRGRLLRIAFPPAGRSRSVSADLEQLESVGQRPLARPFMSAMDEEPSR